jgi:hypothetical protein
MGEEVGAHFCLRGCELLFSFFSSPVKFGGVALLLGCGFGSPIYREERSGWASPGQECRGSDEADGRHGRCCGDGTLPN